MVHEVKEEIEKRNINIFSNKWSHLNQNSFFEHYKIQNSSLLGNFNIVSSFPDIFIEGNLSSSSITDILPEAIIITYNDSIIGLGLPFSHDHEMIVKKAATYNLFNLLPPPFKHFPGVSNTYFCQLKPSKEKYIRTDFKLYGMDGKNAREIFCDF